MAFDAAPEIGCVSKSLLVVWLVFADALSIAHILDIHESMDAANFDADRHTFFQNLAILKKIS